MKTELTKEEIASNGHDKSIPLEIAKMVLKPSEEELAGMTRIPLDQVRPCSFAQVFAQELIEMCKLAKDSQKLYGANWKIWHSNELNIKGVGKRKPPLGRDTILPEGYEVIVINTEKDTRFKIPKINETIVQQWLLQYYRHRRSTTPDYSMGAFELAAREVESKPEDSNDNWKNVIQQ